MAMAVTIVTTAVMMPDKMAATMGSAPASSAMPPTMVAQQRRVSQRHPT